MISKSVKIRVIPVICVQKHFYDSLLNNYLKNKSCIKNSYLLRIKICIGVPLKSHFARILFSKKRRYGSRTYCGRLAKNTNVGTCVFGNCVIYLILMYFPLIAGGGKLAMSGSKYSFNLAVGTFRCLFS